MQKTRLKCVNCNKPDSIYVHGSQQKVVKHQYFLCQNCGIICRDCTFQKKAVGKNFFCNKCKGERVLTFIEGVEI